MHALFESRKRIISKNSLQVFTCLHFWYFIDIAWRHNVNCKQKRVIIKKIKTHKRFLPPNSCGCKKFIFIAKITCAQDCDLRFFSDFDETAFAATLAISDF